MSNTLMQTYDEIKTKYSTDANAAKPITPAQRMAVNTGYNYSNPQKLAHRNQAVKISEKLKEDCYKDLLLDVYTKILPFDTSFIDAHRGQCLEDIEDYLDDKDATACRYFKSAYNETKAPLLGFIISAVESIGQQYVEAEIEKYKEAEKVGISLAAAEMEKEMLDSALVDIKEDDEYEDFIDRLKKKTIDKIVKDITALIKEEKDAIAMSFMPKNESAFLVSFDYISESFLKEKIELPKDLDELIGLAIRESTLNVLDCVFQQPGYLLEHFKTKVRLGRGIVIDHNRVYELIAKFRRLRLLGLSAM
jgi:hypothetical protein